MGAPRTGKSGSSSTPLSCRVSRRARCGRYTLTIEDGDAHHSVTFDEEHTPAQLRPLMEAILRHAATGEDPEATKA